MADIIKAFSYLRVSGLDQVEGDGFDRQRDAILKYANANNIAIEREFVEEGVSGTKETIDRPALTDLISTVLGNGVRLIVVENCTRLARDLFVGELLLREFNRLGVKVVDASGTDLTVADDDPTKKLIRQVLSAVSEYEKTALVLKLRAARVRKKAAGERMEGRKPFGAREGEADILTRIKQLRAEDKSYDTIAQTLNTENTPTRTGKRWHGKVVRGILLRQS